MAALNDILVTLQSTVSVSSFVSPPATAQCTPSLPLPDVASLSPVHHLQPSTEMTDEPLLSPRRPQPTALHLQATKAPALGDASTHWPLFLFLFCVSAMVPLLCHLLPLVYSTSLSVLLTGSYLLRLRPPSQGPPTTRHLSSAASTADAKDKAALQSIGKEKVGKFDDVHNASSRLTKHGVTESTTQRVRSDEWLSATAFRRPPPPSSSASSLQSGSVAPLSLDGFMVRSEEQLSVSKVRRVRERLRIRKVVSTETRLMSVQVQKERVEVQWVPVTDGDEAGEAVGEDSGSDAFNHRSLDEKGQEVVELLVCEERPRVVMEVVPVQRVRVTKVAQTSTQLVGAELKKEHIDYVEQSRDGEKTVQHIG